MFHCKKLILYSLLLGCFVNGYTQCKFSKNFAEDVLSNERNFIVVNVKFNNEHKILIATLLEVSALFDNLSESKFKETMLSSIVSNDTLLINKDSLSYFENRFFDISELKQFSSGQRLSKLLFDKKKCYVKSSFAKKILYRDIDWFRLIYSLWHKRVICKEDDETGSLFMNCKYAH